jgi:diketogulonate reductase-like aldo/keto reductase
MEQRQFGNTGRPVAVVGQGTWYGEQEDRAGAIAALRRGLDLGMTHIDTAEMYLSGEAEKWVAQAIAGRRDEVFLVSKVLPDNASRKGTVRACEASLARLRTGHLDGYLLHWRGRHPLAETVAGFEELVRGGKILCWGVSNFDVADLAELEPLGIPACNQVLYHLEERAIEHAVIPWCVARNCAVVAYSPFGHDRFPNPASAGGKVLREIADAHSATPRQVALRFLLRDHGVLAVPKSSNVTHTEKNAGAGELRLTGAELGRLEKAFPRGPRPRSLPML